MQSRLSRETSGQATLSLVFLVGGIIILISVTLAFLVVTFLNSSYGYQASNRALATAQAGVEDAYLQLARNKDFAPSPYQVTVGANIATVTIAQNAPSTGRVTITATSTVSRYQRKVQAIVSVATSTGELHVLSFELAL